MMNINASGEQLLIHPDIQYVYTSCFALYSLVSLKSKGKAL